MTEETLPVKKGRGRPKKVVAPVKNAPVEVENGDSEDVSSEGEKHVSPPPKLKSQKTPSKKRQAEPETHDDDEEEQDEDEEEAPPPPPKRGRGRPPKKGKAAAAAKKGKPVVGGTGRPRGRPRKNP